MTNEELLTYLGLTLNEYSFLMGLSGIIVSSLICYVMFVLTLPK